MYKYIYSTFRYILTMNCDSKNAVFDVVIKNESKCFMHAAADIKFASAKVLKEVFSCNFTTYM